MSTEADILAELKRIGDLLQENNKVNTDWIVEVRERQAELDTRDEAWKSEMRQSYAEHARIERERLELERQTIQANEERVERWRQEDVERIKLVDARNAKLMTAYVLAKAESERTQEEE